MSKYFECNYIHYACAMADQVAKIMTNMREQDLAELVQKYDFIVGSHETMHKLIMALPKEAKIVYSPYIKDPYMVYAMAKFDIRKLVQDERNKNE